VETELVRCENCNREMGRLEQAYLWQGRPVCDACYRRLEGGGVEGGNLKMSFVGKETEIDRSASLLIRFVNISGSIIALILIIVLFAALSDYSEYARAIEGGWTDKDYWEHCCARRDAALSLFYSTIVGMIALAIVWFIAKHLLELVGKITRRLAGPWKIEESEITNGEKEKGASAIRHSPD